MRAYFVSLGLTFLICKLRTVVVPASQFAVKIKWEHACHGTWWLNLQLEEFCVWLKQRSEDERGE